MVAASLSYRVTDSSISNLFHLQMLSSKFVTTLVWFLIMLRWLWNFLPLSLFILMPYTSLILLQFQEEQFSVFFLVWIMDIRKPLYFTIYC